MLVSATEGFLPDPSFPGHVHRITPPSLPSPESTYFLWIDNPSLKTEKDGAIGQFVLKGDFVYLFCYVFVS